MSSIKRQVVDRAAHLALRAALFIAGVMVGAYGPSALAWLGLILYRSIDS